MVFKSTLLIILAPLMAVAESLTGLSNGSYYATSVADGDTEVVSQREACALAKKELIGYVFGLNTKVTSNVVQTLNEVQLTNKITLDSDKIQLKGVNTNVKSQPLGGRFTSTCTMTYPKSEAKLELARLAKIRQNLDRDKLHRATYENTDPVRFGRVVVRSNAAKSKVFIDDTFWGYAPIEIDRVPLGNHRLSVAADNYVTHIQDFNVELGQLQNLAVTLRRNLATLNVDNLPANSILWIDGIKQPGYRNLTFEPGIKTIRVEAPFYYPYQDKLELTAGAVINHRVVLIPKKVSIGFISKNQIADVYLDGAKIGATPLQKELGVGKYQVDFIGPSGIIHSQSILVTPSKGFTVEALNKPVVANAPKFQNVMLYKDASLNNVKGYKSISKIPAFYPGGTTAIQIELVEPSEGFIYVNSKLAGNRNIVIDDISSLNEIKIEAPGYYSSIIKLPALAKGKLNRYKVVLFRKSNYDTTVVIEQTNFNSEHEQLKSFFPGVNFKLYSCGDSCTNIKGVLVAQLKEAVPAISSRYDSFAYPGCGEKCDVSASIIEFTIGGANSSVSSSLLFPEFESFLMSNRVLLIRATDVGYFNQNVGRLVDWATSFPVYLPINLQPSTYSPSLLNAKRYSK